MRRSQEKLSRKQNRTWTRRHTGGVAYSYFKDGRKFFITPDGLRFYLNDYGTLTTIRTGTVPLFNRIDFNTNHRPSYRPAKLLHGSHFTDYKESRSCTFQDAPHKVQQVPLKHRNKSPPDYVRSMVNATGYSSADAYALDCLKNECPNVFFNWCHLVGRGVGGTDDVENVMAGTTHCNSEQLEIESMLYLMTNVPDLWLKVTAIPKGHHAHLAGTIIYQVRARNTGREFTHKINGLRTLIPSALEFRAVREQLLKSLFTREFLPVGMGIEDP